MVDFLKVFTEMSLDNLFVVAGLVFLALSVIGNITGKIQLGKGGRIAAAAIGPLLISAGLWLHSGHMHATPATTAPTSIPPATASTSEQQSPPKLLVAATKLALKPPPNMTPIQQKAWELEVSGSYDIGPPTDQERATVNNDGRFRTYANGTIYWSPSTGAHEVHGLIRGRWMELGAEHGELGYPTTDEVVTSDRRGKMNRFQKGAIWWLTAAPAAHEVIGAFDGNIPANAN